MGSGLFPLFLMVLVQFVYAGMNITSKLAMLSGMNPLILVAYRQIFATLSIVPFAYWLEWKTLPKMTKRIMYQIILSSLLGITGNQVLFFVGLKYSTATIASALTNLLPAFTFVLAVLFRQENIRMKDKAGIAKVFGTLLCVGGALLLSFYHGKTIGLGESSIHWRFAEKMEGTNSSISKTNLLLGPFTIICSALVWALWFIIQADMSKTFSAPYTSTAYMCFLGSFQCVAIALCFESTASAWSLNNAMRLISSLYAGVICTGLAYCLMSWTIARKGPLYVSIFSPLQLIITALVSWALLREKLYIGTVLGSLLIVLGLYSVLWGKNKEMNNEDTIDLTIIESIKDNEKEEKNDLKL
ncbi:PREDICTED: WAT1-related protein At1g09380-like [Lupinus angustifolius]|uniref:WAT1-related protein At1g09380-like n=1 Tax=Lupinus angustifolius TaxID=3871 RepID=UPI00092E2271|nr:PREDICTED: WAT1-related protein At1g09380-like [Lupinus angustifolius]